MRRLLGAWELLDPHVAATQPRRTWFQRAVDWLVGRPVRTIAATTDAPPRPHDNELDAESVEDRDRQGSTRQQGLDRVLTTLTQEGEAMPLLAAVLVVNQRNRSTETRVVPLADPPLWPIIAMNIGAALSALRSRLDQLIATGHSPPPRSSRWLP